MHNRMKVKNLIQIILVISLLFPTIAFAKPVSLDDPGPKSVNEGATLTPFTLVAHDGTAPYHYTYAPFISGATLNSSTGGFSWTPSNSQAGTYSVTYTVTDSNTPSPGTKSITNTITVVDVTTPVLSPIGSKSTNEGSTLQFTISASDTDGDTLTYSFSATPSLPGATINSSTGVFIWTPGDDKAGSYSVTFKATDPANNFASETITITVNNMVCHKIDLPEINFVGNWLYSPGTKTLTLSNLVVTKSVISSTPPPWGEFYETDQPGIEEIIGAAINVLNLTRNSVNPYLFADSNLSVTETGNTYLSSSLVNIQFTPGAPGPLGQVTLNMNAICFNSHNLPNMDKSSNARPSRFIDTLITEGDGSDYPNMRLTLYVDDGPGLFDDSQTLNSSGSCGGIIESAVGGPTLIDLALFEATPVNREVVVIWVTASEIDNVGFNLYRSESEIGGYVQLNSSIILAEGDSTQGATYQYVDENVKNRKTYYYMLEDIDLYGTSTFHGPISATPRLIFGGINR